MITIVDYGIGNVASVKNMLHKIGVASESSSEASTILAADKIILPGVGSFDTAMERLQQLNISSTIQQFAKSGKPLLGICLGAQLLMNSSEEGNMQGLGLIKGECKKFNGIAPLPIPHMSWNDVTFLKKHPLTGFEDVVPRFYFAHSYYIVPVNKENILGIANYGQDFTCAVYDENIFGVQFHPEKSHRYGIQLFKNFNAL